MLFEALAGFVGLLKLNHYRLAFWRRTLAFRGKRPITENVHDLAVVLKLAIGSDEKTSLTDFVVDELRKKGHQLSLFGPLMGEPMGWPDVGERVALEVSQNRADQAVVFCWTGTGVTIAANKVPGVRAALCGDAETAKGARLWDDANVLAMSLRGTSTPVAREILDSWFSTKAITTGTDAELIERAKALDAKYARLA